MLRDAGWFGDTAETKERPTRPASGKRQPLAPFEVWADSQAKLRARPPLATSQPRASGQDFQGKKTNGPTALGDALLAPGSRACDLPSAATRPVGRRGAGSACTSHCPVDPLPEEHPVADREPGTSTGGEERPGEDNEGPPCPAERKTASSRPEVLCARRVLGAEAARQRSRGGRSETRRPVATDCAPRLSSLPPRRGYVPPHSHGGGTSPAAAMARVRGPGQGRGTGVASVLLRRPRLASTGAPLWSSYKHAVKSPSDSLDRLAASHAAPFFQCPQVRRRLLRTMASGWFRGEQPPGLGVCSLTQEAQERVTSLRENWSSR